MIFSSTQLSNCVEFKLFSYLVDLLEVNILVVTRAGYLKTLKSGHQNGTCISLRTEDLQCQ